MRKVFIAAAAMLAVGLIVTMIPTPALADGNGVGIAGSPHDFATESWNGRKEICRVCHVPHDHGRVYVGPLLWSHDLSEETYTPYSSDTMNATMGQPSGYSKLCLGCHDGTVALGAFDKYGSEGSTPPPADDKMGDSHSDFVIPGIDNDLSRTHPLSITYEYPADTGLNDPAVTTIGTSGKIEDVLQSGKLQCSSCHDVHDQESVAGTHLLRVATKVLTDGGGDPIPGTEASGLCLTCHIK